MESAGESKQAISAVVKAYTESGVKKKVTSEPVGPTKDITDSSTETAPASPISSDSQQSDFDPKGFATPEGSATGKLNVDTLINAGEDMPQEREVTEEIVPDDKFGVYDIENKSLAPLDAPVESEVPLKDRPTPDVYKDLSSNILEDMEIAAKSKQDRLVKAAEKTIIDDGIIAKEYDMTPEKYRLAILDTYAKKMLDGIDYSEYETQQKLSYLQEQKGNLTPGSSAIEGMDSEIKSLEKKRSEYINNRVAQVGAQIENIKATIDYTDKSDTKAKLEEIKKLEMSLKPVINPVAYARGKAETSDVKAMPGDTPMEQLTNYYHSLAREYSDIANNTNTLEMITSSVPILGDVMGTREVRDRFYELRQELIELTPIVTLNRKELKEDNFFSQLAKGTVGALLSPNIVTTEQQQANKLYNSFEAAGVSSNLSEEADEAMQESLDPTLMEEIGSMTGFVAGMMPAFVSGGAIVKGIGTVARGANLLNKVDKFSKMNKATRLLVGATTKGLEYEAAGAISTSSTIEEEASFLSGFMGETFTRGLSKLVPKKVYNATMLKLFGGSSNKVKDIFMKSSAKVASKTGYGFGEVAEEYGNEIGNIINESDGDLKKFIALHSERFGDFDENVKFGLMTFGMGMAFGAATNSGKAFMTTHKKWLGEQTPEVQSKFTTIASDIKKDLDSVSQEAAPAVEEVKENETEPEAKGNTETVDDVMERSVTLYEHQGGTLDEPVVGDLVLDGQRVVVETKDGKIYDIGNKNDIGLKAISELGMSYDTPSVSVTKDSELRIGDDSYTIQEELPTQGVEYDETGDVLSASVLDASGKPTMFKGALAEEIALQVLLNKTQTDNQKNRIDKLLEQDEEFNDEIRAIEEVAEKEADKNTEQTVEQTGEKAKKRLISDEAYAKAEKELKDMMGNLSSGTGFKGAGALAVVVARKLEDGAISIADITTEMVQMFSEDIRPYVQAAYDSATKTKLKQEEKVDDLPTFKRKLREMKVVQKDLKGAQEKLKNLIRAFIPSGPYGKNQVNTLVRIVEQATVKNYNNQVERIIKVIDHQREKSKKSLITKMVSFIKASSRNAKTKKGVRRSTGISAKGSSFFKSAKRVIENSMNQDFDKLDEAQKNIDDSLVESAITKEQNGEPLTIKEQAAIDEALAYELFSGINDMSIEQVQEIFNDLKEKKSEFREEFKNRRIIKAEEVKQIKKEAKEQISKDYTLLYNEDGSRKGVDQLLKQRKEIWESFKKLKVWDGIKKWAGLYDFRTSRGFTDYMRNNIDHLATLSNLLDKSGKFFTNNLYNALNKMYDNHWGGFFKQRDNLDVMVNSIDGVKGGYKQFISNLNPKNITLKGILTQGKNPTDYTVDTDEAMRIYALSKNDIQREKLLAMGFTDKKMDELKDHIGTDAVTFADKVVEYLSDEYYESVNDVFKFINNTNLGQTENYFPTQTVSVEVNAKDLKDSSFKKIFDAETANALKDRIDLKGDIKLQGIRFTSTLENHFESMERFKSYAIGVQKIVALFESKDVNMLLDETGLKSAIKNSVNAMINPGSVIKQKQNFVDNFLSRYIRYALNFKVVQIAKQATSFVQAFEDYSFRGEGKQNVIIDLPMFMLEYAATIATLPSQYKKFKNLSPTFRKRMEEGLKGDIYGLETGQAVFKPISKKSTKTGSFLRGYQKAGAFGTVAGDALGVMGYMVNYNRDIANGIDEATALSNLNNYNATQQTRRGTEKSGIQLNPSTSSRVFTMFGSTLFLQINKVRSSTINITRAAMDGKAPKAKDVRALALNFAIANILFTFMANIAKFIGGDEEDKEAGLQAIKDAGMGLSLLYQIPFIGSGVEAAMNKARGSRMPSSTVVNPFDRLFKDLYKAADEKDVLAGVKPIIELTIGAKIDPVIGLYNMYGGDFDDGMYDLVGISKSYKPGYGRKKPKQKTIEQLDAAYRSDQRKATKGFNSGGYGKGKSKGFGTKGYD